jgi:RNase P subunit RPR2
MTTVHLRVDSEGEGWAMVRCDRCNEVHRYRAGDAAQGKVTCSCGHTMDVRAKVVAEVEERTEAAHELHRVVTGADPCDGKTS